MAATRKPAPGKASAGKQWNPEATRESARGEPAELMEPRPPTTSRYPISNEEFMALKLAAPRARLPRKTATLAKDRKSTDELAALPEATVPLAPGLAPSKAPTGSTNFAGIAFTQWIPPDCTMATGPSHVMLAVNSSVAVFAKTGGAALMQRTLTQWFANVATNLTIFDPKLLYDQHAGRWVLLAAATGQNPNTSLQLLSVSTTSDPRQPWRNHRFDAMLDGRTKTNNWADFPGLGVDHHALYITSNMFAFGGAFKYAKIRVIPKAGPYSGGAAPYFDFTKLRNADNTLAFTVQPCHTFGAPRVEYLVNTAFPSGNTLTLWHIAHPTTAPTLARTQVTVSPYSLAPNADQKGGAQPLNTGDVRVLHAVCRGGDVWTAFTTAHSWGSGPNRAAVQWCQLRASTSAVVQQGVFGASSFHYFFPAACPDNNGNMIIVMSRSGPGEFGSVLYSGRRATDALGTLQPSTLLKKGVAHYQRLDGGGRNRWGDYNGVASDPANGRLVWLHGEYASALDTWGTWVGSAFF